MDLNCISKQHGQYLASHLPPPPSSHPSWFFFFYARENLWLVSLCISGCLNLHCDVKPFGKYESSLLVLFLWCFCSEAVSNMHIIGYLHKDCKSPFGHFSIQIFPQDCKPGGGGCFERCTGRENPFSCFLGCDSSGNTFSLVGGHFTHGTVLPLWEILNMAGWGIVDPFLMFIKLTYQNQVSVGMEVGSDEKWGGFWQVNIKYGCVEIIMLGRGITELSKMSASVHAETPFFHKRKEPVCLLCGCWGAIT